MNSFVVKQTVRNLLIPSVNSRRVNACVYKRAKKHIAKKGFDPQPRVALQAMDFTDWTAATYTNKPLVLLNPKKTFQFFVFPNFLKQIINHESKHLEQHIMKRLPDIKKNIGLKENNNFDYAQKFYEQNSKKINLIIKNLARVSKIKASQVKYPKKEDFFKEYHALKEKKVPFFMRPIKAIKLEVEKFKANTKYQDIHDALFIEKEAIAAEKNNGSVFD